MLDHKTFGSNIALKLDIKKAFDTVDWDFMVLQTFGFDETFCKWIKVILHSAKLSFMVNGKLVGFFPCTQAKAHQGDLYLSFVSVS